ncbi:hypothetical protein CEUSTIGMA_g6831.t1 [Chlamydomonas eustigma]|uniref:Sugar phosphate transporter domain-containing protein n=1 Tax=Chlamydomonas eustigma TaxID=1157962 RepID=A0A250X9E4_9CHLO|nr:hypothetical protein CEUSTIGMA_g6831.t1 [Chlamydomonas eustigma]|eukprot:GAX79390.1 hypothetical protein CEUSTIGMA_g6831.t1 [Chlamydomonas eustigma]
MGTLLPIHTDYRWSLLSAVTYGVIAIAANFVNKGAMLCMPGHPNSVLLLQLITMYITILGLRTCKIVSFPSYSWASLLYLNVAVYNTLKRLTPVLVLVFKASYERKAPGVRETCCVMLIVVGCIIAGAGDLAFSIPGYAAAFICAVFQAAYILLAEDNERRGQVSDQRSGAADCHPSATLKVSDVLSSLKHGSSDSTHKAPTSEGDWMSGVNLKDASVGIHHLDQQTLLGDVMSPSTVIVTHHQLHYGMKAPSNSAKALIPNLSSPSEVLYYASASMLPVLAIATVLAGELGTLGVALSPSCQHTAVLGFGLQLACIAWIETALAGSLVWCTEGNGSLTTSIVGVLKGVVAVVLGLMFMTGPSKEVSMMNLAGIGMVLVGGSWYSSLKCIDYKTRN